MDVRLTILEKRNPITMTNLNIKLALQLHIIS